jgi:hypothetical protein
MTESNNGNGKWAAEGLGPRQIKRVNDLLAKIRWEHNNYVSLKRQFDGVNFHEDRTTYNNLFGVNCRADLLEKVNALKARYQGTITVANLKEIEGELQEILEWAQKNRPVKDERESEEVLRQRHETVAKQIEETHRKEEEFKASSILIPEGKRGVVLKICFDNSDAMTDYFDRHHSLESFLLAIIPDGREDERSLRNVIDRIPALKEIPFEWHIEKYSMGHGAYLESKTCPETRKHPYKEHQVNCHYEITFQRSYRNHENRAIPHPEYYLGEVGSNGGNGGNGKETVLEMTIRENKAMNGVEILFPSKPAREVIDTLKGYGFRWSFKQGLWWKRNTPGLINSMRNTFPLAVVEGEEPASN